MLLGPSIQYYFTKELSFSTSFFCRASRTRYPSHEPSSLIAFRNFNEETKRPGVWETEQGAASTADNLASLYRPPFHLMFHGSFEKVTGIFLLKLISTS